MPVLIIVSELKSKMILAKPSGWRVSPDESTEQSSSTSGNRSTALSNSRHVKSTSETSKLPPAVATVSLDAVRSYVHSKRVENYLMGDTLGEGSFAKVKEAFHVLVGEKVIRKLTEWSASNIS